MGGRVIMVSVIMLIIGLGSSSITMALGSLGQDSTNLGTGRAYPLAKQVAARENNNPSRALWLSKHLISKRKNIAIKLKTHKQPQKIKSK